MPIELAMLSRTVPDPQSMNCQKLHYQIHLKLNLLGSLTNQRPIQKTKDPRAKVTNDEDATIKGEAGEASAPDVRLYPVLPEAHPEGRAYQKGRAPPKGRAHPK